MAQQQQESGQLAGSNIRQDKGSRAASGIGAGVTGLALLIIKSNGTAHHNASPEMHFERNRLQAMAMDSSSNSSSCCTSALLAPSISTPGSDLGSGLVWGLGWGFDCNALCNGFIYVAL